MHVIRRRGWEIPERLATPERLFIDRRALLAATGAAALSLSLKPALAQWASDIPDPSSDLYPAKRNETFTLDRPVTDEKIQYQLQQFL
jgi:sulfoxide reductase catalytic subunit YedY